MLEYFTMLHQFILKVFRLDKTDDFKAKYIFIHFYLYAPEAVPIFIII